MARRSQRVWYVWGERQEAGESLSCVFRHTFLNTYYVTVSTETGGLLEVHDNCWCFAWREREYNKKPDARSIGIGNETGKGLFGLDAGGAQVGGASMREVTCETKKARERSLYFLSLLARLHHVRPSNLRSILLQRKSKNDNIA